MGAYCRLEPNGLKAAQAIHPRLYAAIRKHGVVARPVLVHDTDGKQKTQYLQTQSQCLQIWTVLPACALFISIITAILAVPASRQLGGS